MRIGVKAVPGSARTSVGGSHAGALVVRVVERPVDGKANEAVLAALASALGIRRRDLALVSGSRGRNKIVEVEGDDEALAARVALLLGAHDGETRSV